EAGIALDETNTPPIDDMKDDTAKWPLLQSQLAVCETVLGEAYRKADKSAIDNQWHHRLITLISAGCGTLAVLLAIISVSQKFSGPYVLAGEILAVLIALIAVVLGVYAALQSRWLRDRHWAERC